MKILILGGSGNAGFTVARYLLAHTREQLILASRRMDICSAQAAWLNSRFGEGRVACITADAADRKSLIAAFSQAKLVIIASSTSVYAENIAFAALHAGVDLLDMSQATPEKYAVYERLAPIAAETSRLFLLDAGLHPGMPAVLARYTANWLDVPEEIHIAASMQVNWRSLQLERATMREFTREMRHFEPSYYEDGAWINDMERRPEFQFTQSQNSRPCTPMMLEELRDLPQNINGLRSIGFYMAGFNPVVDKYILPAVWTGQKVLPRLTEGLLSRMLHWGLSRFTDGPYLTEVMAVSRGIRRGSERLLKVSVAHPNAYALTAASVVACVRQYLEMKDKPAGVFLQGQWVDPVVYLEDLNAMHMKVQILLDNEPRSIHPPRTRRTREWTPNPL